LKRVGVSKLIVRENKEIIWMWRSLSIHKLLINSQTNGKYLNKLTVCIVSHQNVIIVVMNPCIDHYIGWRREGPFVRKKYLNSMCLNYVTFDSPLLKFYTIMKITKPSFPSRHFAHFMCFYMPPHISFTMCYHR